MALGSGALCTHEGLRPGSLQPLAGKQLDEALRELRAQLLFELGELVRERRLGHVEPLGSSRDLSSSAIATKYCGCLIFTPPAFHERAPSLLFPPATLYKL